MNHRGPWGDVHIVRSTMALLVAGAVWLPVSTSQAVELGGDFRLQMNVGGERLAQVRYSDGSESDLNAGTYFTFGLGASVTLLQMDSHALALLGSVGWSGWSTGPENTDDRLRLTHIPIDLLAFYRFDLPERPVAILAGGGIGYHFVGGVAGTGNLDGFELDLDNALAGIGELRVVWEIVAVGIRYTAVSYGVARTNGDVNASSWGVSLGLVWPPARSE